MEVTPSAGDLSARSFTFKGVQRHLVVFKADAQATGAVPPACLTSGSQTGLCNVYSGTQVMSTLNQASFTTSNGTCGTAPDAAWCPLTRDNTQDNANDVGVYFRVLSRYQTGFFPGTGITITKTQVMRIEPKVGG